MPLLQLTAPAAPPLDVAEVRQHIKQDSDFDDNLIGRYLEAARDVAEAETGRQLVAARFRYVMDSFPGPQIISVPFGVPFGVPPHSILLPRSPLIRLVGVHYLDMAGQSQTVPEDLYTLDAAFEPARITPKFGKIWPIPLPQVGSVWVDFESGYVTPVFVNTAANTVTLAGWKPLAVGDAVRLSNSGGLLPAPLKPDRNYFVAAVVSESVYQLADTPGGATIDLRADGTGTHYLGQPGAGGNEGKIPANILAWMLLRAGSLYEHRTETAITKGAVTPLPYAEHLLDPYRLRTV